MTLSDRELYNEIGTALLGEADMGFGTRDNGEAERWAKNWLNLRTNALIRVLCTSDLRLAVGAGGADDVAAVATLLYSAYPDVVTVVAVSVLVLRRGLDTVCATYDG